MSNAAVQRERDRRQFCVWVLVSADATGTTARAAARLFERAFVETPTPPSSREATAYFRIERLEDYLPTPEAWETVRDRLLLTLDAYDTHREEVDAIVQAASPRWRLNRMPILDRTLLRVGVVELCFADKPRARATINGLVDLAKRLGSDKTSAFVNGILDQIRRDRGIPFE